MLKFLLLFFISLNVNSETLYNCKVIRVKDGDTIKAQCNDELLDVRLYCIDAPEKKMDFADLSKSTLSLLTNITIDIKNTDIYGRKVAEIISQNNINANKYLVEVGEVAVYPQYCTDQSYYDLQTKAKDKQLGIWSKSGLHQTPWIYRSQKRRGIL